MDKKINARKKAQRLARQRKMRNRRIALTICLMVAVCLVSVGGTIAWLTAESSAVTNTFTVGNITIDLKEHKYVNGSLSETETTTEQSYQMIPGETVAKDPFVTVNAGSEKCWVFVEIVEVNEAGSFMEYAASRDWTEVTGVTGPNGGKVYKYNTVVDATSANQDVYILNSNQVTMLGTVTKEAYANLTDETYPKLTFYGYAIQSENLEEDLTNEQIWNLAKPSTGA